MLADSETRGSDDWWLMRLITAHGKGLPRLAELRDVYAGTNAINVSSGPGSEDFQKFLATSRLNIAELIVSAPVARMDVRGIRTSIAGDSAGDKAVADVYDKAKLRLQLPEVFTDMAVYGTGWMVATQGSVTRVSPWYAYREPAGNAPWESQAAVLLTYDPGTNRRAAQLYREHEDSDGTQYITVRKAISGVEGELIPTDGSVWQPTEDWDWDGEEERLDWADEIPLIALDAPGGVGQFERHLDAINRLHIMLYNRTVIMTMQAFRQRYLSGKLPERYPKGHPNEGEKIDYDSIFSYGPAALIRLPENVELSELQSTDASWITNTIAQDLKNLAAVTGTPLYMLVPDAVQGSATGASIARETLVAKTTQLIRIAEVAIARVVWLHCQAAGIHLEENSKLRLMWAPVDTTSMSEKSQAASQAASTLPIKTIWREVYQFTDEQIEQAELDLDDAQFSGVNQSFGSTTTSTGVEDGASVTGESGGTALESDSETTGSDGGSSVGTLV